MMGVQADVSDDAQRWWQAYVLARRGDIEGLREVVTGAGAQHRAELMRWLANDGRPELTRLAAELGDDHARARYERWLDRVRARAAAGNPSARELLAELELPE
jgi:hypothetical protein